MADRGKRDEKEISKFKYLEKQKSFFSKIKSIFHNFCKCFCLVNYLKIGDTFFSRKFNFSRMFTLSTKT